MMTEDDINRLPVDKLFDLLMTSTKELIDLNCERHEAAYEKKKSEVQLIQRIIVAKRAELPPLV